MRSRQSPGSASHHLKCPVPRKDCGNAEWNKAEKDNYHLASLTGGIYKTNETGEMQSIKTVTEETQTLGLKLYLTFFFNLNTRIYFIYFHPKWFIIFKGGI